MSARHPIDVEPDEHGIYYLGKVGQRTQMTRSHLPPPIPPQPPVPGDQRHRLPPPSHLHPPFTPASPKIRPQYSDLPARAHVTYAPQPLYLQNPPPDPNPRWQPAPQPAQAQYGPHPPHPPLVAQRDSFSSRNPGTVYEAISPVGHWPTASPGRTSLFNEAAYTPSSFPQTSPQANQAVQSPSGSYHSSTTSSSGHGTAPVQYSKPSKGARPEIGNIERKPQDNTSRYVFTVRQQPIAARACGFGERDRRVIDPPPIVQLSLKDFDPNSSADIAQLQYQFNIVHCALLSVPPASSTSTTAYAPNTSSDVTAVPDPNQSNRLSRRLMGTLVANPFLCMDPDIPGGEKSGKGDKSRKSSGSSSPSSTADVNSRIATFFIFPDLSCRQNGLYRLRFTLMKLPIPNFTSSNNGPRGEDTEGYTVGCVDSDVFEVYSAKDFPGMRPSTRLTKELKRMGAAVSVKKGKGYVGGDGKKRDSGESVGSGGSDGSQPDSPVKGKGRQRKKRA